MHINNKQIIQIISYLAGPVQICFLRPCQLQIGCFPQPTIQALSNFSDAYHMCRICIAETSIDGLPSKNQELSEYCTCVIKLKHC